MLTMVKSQEKKTPKEIESQYPNCKYILTDFSDLNNISGLLYAVSPDKDSFLDLCEISDELTDEGITCCIMGEYNEGGMIGVQREYR